MGLRDCIFGTITGGIIYGPVAGTAVNVGAAIASGLFSGLISALFNKFVYSKLNANQLRDSYGVSNTLLVSFLGGFLIAPIILIAYYHRDWILTTFEVSNFDKEGLPLVNASIAGWILSYVGVSIAIGLLSGAVAGALLSCFRGGAKSHNQDFFSLNYGLNSLNFEAIYEDTPIITNY